MNDTDVGSPDLSCVAEEIAVDLPHRDMVIDYLTRFDPDDGPPAEPGAANEVLDLGVIKLRTVSRMAERIRVGEWGSKIPRNPAPEFEGIELSDTDTVLGGLRLAIGARNSGWYPNMGKVRNTDIGGLPHIGAGWEYPAVGDPAEISAFQLPSAESSAGEDVVIGVIDSPMYPHRDLKARWYAPHWYSSEWDHLEVHPWLRGHSVFVAGCILKRAPAAQLEVRGVLKSNVPRATVWTVATAMTEAFEMGVELLNLSLGCYTRDGQAPFVLARAVEVLSQRGVTMIAAAGNHGDGTDPHHRASAPIFPAACPGAVAVGAFENSPPYKRAALSPQAPWIQLGAPGVGVMSTYFHGDVMFNQLDGLPKAPGTGTFPGSAKWSGTSFAAGTVSGEIARLMSEGMTAEEAVSHLRNTDPNTNHGIGRY
jgi:hypothetical protein